MRALPTITIVLSNAMPVSPLTMMFVSVPAAEVAEILALEIPPHPETTFNERFLTRLIASSFSINLEEKRAALAKLDKLTQDRIDELLRVLLHERTTFILMSANHAARVREMEFQHAGEWTALEAQHKTV